MTSTIIPHSELLRRAVKFIDSERSEHPEKKLYQILDDACMRFNLSPMDAEALTRLFSEDDKNTGG